MRQGFANTYRVTYKGGWENDRNKGFGTHYLGDGRFREGIFALG
jgi:hypothetical protein